MSAHLSIENKRYPATTIQSWKNSGVIPARHHDWVLRRARELSLDLGPEDFFTDRAMVKKRKRVAS